MPNLDKKYPSELDYFVECIKELRRLRKESLLAAEKFRHEMIEYFRLPSDMESVFVHDTLLRLAETPAGTSSNRKDEQLKTLHAMENGDRFTLFGTPCIFRYHTGRRKHPREGFFEYVYEENLTSYRTLEYNEAWTFLTEGDMILNVSR